jgi:soluble lytic murein transglycosylase-like protein
MAAREARLTLRHRCAAFAAALALHAGVAWAGAQRYEPLSASVKAQLQRAIADLAAPRLAFADPFEGQVWLKTMSSRLAPHVPDEADRIELLTTIHYEATRAGLDPQMVLGLIQVESRFRKFAVSRAGARGYMQVMPFWIDTIGEAGQNLFNLRTNLRYGCTILRHYLDIERGNVFRALGRYNGSLGKAEYPKLVQRAWMQTWRYEPESAQMRASAPPRPQRYVGTP